MFKTKASKILGFIALFLVIIFSWVMINDARHKRDSARPEDEGINDPFGASDETVTLPGGAKNDDLVPSNTGSEQPSVQPSVPSPDITIIEDNPTLRQLTTTAVAGFTFTSEERELPEDPAATPDANIVEVYDFSGYRTIKFGDKADEVVAIKTVLNREKTGLALIINTDYDTDMKNAVVDFQNRSGLTGDGVIGPKTYAKLNAFQGLTAYTSAPKKKNTETVELVRYVESGSGTLFDRAIRKMEEAKRITNNSVPRVAEAFFDDTAERVVMRYLKDGVIETYVARLTFPKVDPNLPKEERDAIPRIAAVDGDFLPEGIIAADVSPDRKSFFYTNPIMGGSAGIVYTFATKGKKQILETPLTEWIADFGSNSRVNITTKASGTTFGYSYSLDVKTGAMYKNVGGKNGLTTLMSPDGRKILFAEYANNGLTTSIADLATGKVTVVSPSALPEKCVWTKDSLRVYCAAMTRSLAALYPDDWYQGSISFDDALWMIDTSDYRGNIVFDMLTKSKARIDATNLTLNGTENYLGFINKKDGSLWGFDLSH